MTKLPRVAMISGASRGIGAAVARRLFDSGWAVSLGIRDPVSSPLQENKNVLVCRFDALDPDSERAWVEATVDRFGRLDGLVHNAGIAFKKSVLEADDPEFDQIFAVNVKSPMRVTQHAWRHLIISQGRIIVMASLSGKRVKLAGMGLYAMSKFAAVGLAHALRQCGKDVGVRATAICPSFVATEMAASLGTTEPSELTQPDDLAKIVHLVLELPKTASIAEIPVHWAVEDCF